MFQKLHTKIQKKCPGKLTGDIILLNDNACCSVAQGGQDQLNVMWWG